MRNKQRRGQASMPIMVATIEQRPTMTHGIADASVIATDPLFEPVAVAPLAPLDPRLEPFAAEPEAAEAEEVIVKPADESVAAAAKSCSEE